MRLLFISNLFPDTREPYRGLDNATVLHHLAAQWKIRTLALRPTLPFRSGTWTARKEDRVLQPEFLATPYLPKIGSRWNHRLMARALRERLQSLRTEFPFDVVLSSWIYPDSCAVALLAEELGFHFVAIAQGSDVHQYLQHPVRRKIITRALPSAFGVITRSAELARLLGDAGVDAEKLHPIYNGVDHACFRAAERAAARQALGLPADKQIILFVGNFYAIKNPLLVIEAHSQVCDDNTLSHTKLIMIGDGPLVGSARELGDRLHFGANVVLTGRKTSAEIALYMQAADVLCLPSVNEGVPNVILEAFACGLPVVASRVGGIPEVHPGESCGRLVEPRLAPVAAALRAILREVPPSAPIAEYGAQFTWEKTAAEYHALLAPAAGL
ncbi:MAG: glycosyltransferase [Chthoniobacter sp.]|nr:glycosyltransferase [Chthoniobacter sp.]